MALYRGTKHGDRVRYKCNTGHKLVGDRYLTCDGGEWKGQVPECKAGGCNMMASMCFYLFGAMHSTPKSSDVVEARRG